MRTIKIIISVLWLCANIGCGAVQYDANNISDYYGFDEIEIEDLNIQPDESYKIQLPMEREHNLLRLKFEPGDVVNIDECAIKDQDDLPHIIWKPISFSYLQPDSSSDREQ